MPLVVISVLFVVCCSLFVICCSQRFVRCSLFVVCRLVMVVSCSLCVACCLFRCVCSLFVERCVSLVVVVHGLSDTGFVCCVMGCLSFCFFLFVVCCCSIVVRRSAFGVQWLVFGVWFVVMYVLLIVRCSCVLFFVRTRCCDVWFEVFVVCCVTCCLRIRVSGLAFSA